MVRLFDSHCHIADPAFSEDLDAVIDRCRASGVERALVVADPAEEEPNQERVFRLVERHDFLYAAIGVHPHNAERYSDRIEETLLAYIAHPKCRLWGEIGLDYYYDLSERSVQREVFGRQLALAAEKGMPVQLHVREAHGDCMEILRAHAARGTLSRGIMHCFSGAGETARVYLGLGMMISFSGAVTFKNAARLAEAAQTVPADRMLIETDSPYLSPVPLRGRRNEPAHIVHTFERLCQLRGETPEALSEQLWKNTCGIIAPELLRER